MSKAFLPQSINTSISWNLFNHLLKASYMKLFNNLPDAVVYIGETIPELRMEHICQDLDRLCSIQKTLDIPNLSNTELEFVSHSLTSITPVSSAAVRMESQGGSQEALKYRCEGMMSSLMESIKKFFEWLYQRFKNIFTGNINQGGSASVNGERSVSISQDRGVRKKFKSKELNKYFYFTTEGEAIAELNWALKNLGPLDQAKKVVVGFPFKDYILAECEKDLEKDLPEEFLKKMLECGTDLTSYLETPDPDFKQGFVISTKLQLGMKDPAHREFKVVRQKSKVTDPCDEIEIFYDLSTGFGKAVNTACAKYAHFTSEGSESWNKTRELFTQAESAVPAEKVLVHKNIMLAGKILSQWLTVIEYTEHIVKALNHTLDNLERKD